MQTKAWTVFTAAPDEKLLEWPNGVTLLHCASSEVMAEWTGNRSAEYWGAYLSAISTGRRIGVSGVADLAGNITYVDPEMETRQKFGLYPVVLRYDGTTNRTMVESIQDPLSITWDDLPLW